MTRVEEIIDRILEFPEGLSFELLKPLTDLRRDPDEARILYSCRQISGATQEASTDDEYVIKVKIQVPKPDGTQSPLPGPSATTSAELEALEAFRKAGLPFVPHLITASRLVQGNNGLLPGGYISITVMTKMPGQTIWDLRFWSLPEEEREEIRQIFLQELKQVWKLGIAPYDCALRNILWDGASKKCSIIDFEHWKPFENPSQTITESEEIRELQRWGVVQRPPPATWAQEWGLIK